MSTQTTEQRTRTTCDECGLPYYADENDACPYCDTASTDPAAESTEPAPQESTPTEPESTDQPRSRPRQPATDGSSGSSSWLDRLVAGVRDFLRK